MSLVHNEKAKLTATYLNGMAIALAVVGGVAPWITFLIQPLPASPATLTIMSFGCICLSLSLHFGARKMLDRLREP